MSEQREAQVLAVTRVAQRPREGIDRFLLVEHGCCRCCCALFWLCRAAAGSLAVTVVGSQACAVFLPVARCALLGAATLGSPTLASAALPLHSVASRKNRVLGELQRATQQRNRKSDNGN